MKKIIFFTLCLVLVNNCSISQKAVVNKNVIIFSGVKQEEETKRNLEVIRMAVKIYYSNHNKWPSNLHELVSEYGILKEIPFELIIGSNKVVEEFDGAGGWYYKEGLVKLNVKGKDSKGKNYSEW